VQFSVAQNNQQPSFRSFNNIFDSLIINDSTIPVIEYKDSLLELVRDSLVYDLQKSYCGRENELLDGHYFTNGEKIRYLKNAYNHSNDFCNIENKVIEFWKKNNEAKKIMDTLYSKVHCELSNDPRQHYRYFDFITNNALPGSVEMMEEYIKNRPTLKIKHDFEYELIYRLILAGKENTALDFLKVLVADYKDGKIKNLLYGSREFDTNVFDLLCFSNNSAIRSEALKLAWTYYEASNELFELVWYLDKQNVILYLQKKFQYYTTLDLGIIEPADQLNKQRQKLPDAPDTIQAYMQFMFKNSSWLGKVIGKQLWTEFNVRMPYWELYTAEYFLFYQLDMLEGAFYDNTLSKAERRQMLLDLKRKDFKSIFKMPDPTSHVRSRQYSRLIKQYLQLIKQVYPDGHIPAEDVARLNLCELTTCTIPITYEQAKPRNIFDIHELVADTKRYELGSVQLKPSLPDYWCFKWAQEEFNENFNWVFSKTGVYRMELGTDEYKELFDKYFAELLAQKGITDIVIKETFTKVANGYLHRVSVRSKEAAYKKDFIVPGNGSRYPPVGLVKMINLLLIKKQVKERIIEIKHDDWGQWVDYGLYEPEKINLFLNKYGVKCSDLSNTRSLMN
jgi:hypothetical protein